MLKLPYVLLSKNPNKNIQTAGSLCLSKVVQNTTDELLSEILSDLTDKMVAVFKLNSFKAHAALLETLISIVFHVEILFADYAQKFIPVLFDLMRHDDGAIKKVAIDAIYSLAAIVPDEVIKYRLEIL